LGGKFPSLKPILEGLPVWWHNKKKHPATGVSWVSGMQLTKHFIELVVVETKRFVGSNVNVILTRQTCGQLQAVRALFV